MIYGLKNIISNDLGFEDITTRALIPKGMQVNGKIISNEEGTVAGVYLASEIFTEFGVETKIMKMMVKRFRKVKLSWKSLVILMIS